MTGFVIDLLQKQLTVATDTMCYVGADSRPLGFVAKILPLPTVQGVMFGRGQTDIALETFGILLRQYDLESIEEAAERLPEILRGATERYADDQGIEDHREFAMFGCCLAGVSKRDGKAKIWEFENVQDFEPRGPRTGPAVITLPALPQRYVPPGVKTMTQDRALVAIMRAMRNYFAETPDARTALGGEIVAWTVAAAGMSYKALHRFEDFEETRRVAAVVRERVSNGDFEPVIETLARADQLRGPAANDALVDATAVATAEAAPTGRAERRRLAQLARKEAKRTGRAA